MITSIGWMAGLVALAAMCVVPSQPGGEPAGEKHPAYVLDHTARAIDGTETDLARYKGKVIVIVNVASKCGFTPQYEGLQKLYEKHKGAGLEILAFPSNDFREQEPGASEEIAAFCRENYGVTFPLFEKIRVVKGNDAEKGRAEGTGAGREQHPLYKDLTGQPEPIGGDPKWNFTKFVVDRDGRVVARFDADRKYVRTAELEPELVKKVETLLGAGAPGTHGPETEGAESPAAAGE